MNKIIKKIEIRNFRSIHQIELKCDEVNIFSGLNDSGKSNVLRAVNLFFNNHTDFQVPLDFKSDFCKVELAKAQKSSKSKQLIKIKIFIDPPDSFISLKDEGEIYLEKSYDRENNVSLTYSSNDVKVKTSISKIFNRIKYIYIPALKGPDVIQYLLGLLGEYQLIGENDIEGLNDKIQENTKDLADLLNTSQIHFTTNFGLPVLLSDFWRKLNVGTLYEKFDLLDDTYKSSPKSKIQKLSKSFYEIPLSARGDGIKSKFIPPILKWIQNKNPSNFFVWGIDEPENSLEFRAAEEMSNLFFNDYGVGTQIFLTTHSLAFLSPGESIKVNPKLIRCFKSALGDTKIELFDDLFSQISHEELLEEIGVLEIQKKVFEEWRIRRMDFESRINEYHRKTNNMQADLDTMRKPLIITEGKTDWRHLKKALTELEKKNLLQTINIGFYECDDFDMGADELEKMCISFSKIKQNQKVIFIFDRDIPKYLKNKGDGLNYKDWGNNVYSFCIPCPPHRRNYQNISIEFYYDDEDLKRKTIDGKRLLFTNEVEEVIVKNMTTNNLESKKYILLDDPISEDEFTKKVCDQYCDDIYDKNGVNCAISKTVFANNIFSEMHGFSNVNFQHFKLIFDVIVRIVNNLT